VLEEAHDSEELIGRVAALDIGKAQLVCCVRVPSPDRPGKRLQEVRTYSTMTRSLLVLADRLAELGVTRVVMEATSDYWKPVVRHEVPRIRAEVKGLRLRPVAAGR
jgi:transposase